MPASDWLPPGPSGLSRGSMTSIASVDQTTPAEIAAPATSRAMRVLGPIAAVLAMLSAFATFVVLADLTPIAPTHTVVVTLLLINALTVFLLVGIIAHEVWLVVQARRRGRAAARLHVQIVGLFAVIAAVPAILVARGGERHARPRPRPAVLDAHPRHHRELADRRRCLSAGARADDPRRHHGDVVRRGARQAAVRFRSASASSSSSPRRRGCAGCRPR